MASKGATVKVSFIGDATQFRQVVQQIQQDADKVEQSSGKFGALGGAITKLGIAAAGIGGFVALKGALTDAVDAANESARVAAQTEAALKSTGGAAGVSAQQVGDLATALSKVAPFDDEVIQSGENLLLTFTNVKNAAGQGNDIFNQTTKIALDMSTALGTDLNSSVLQLGKALNDPTQGLTALQRVGVTFTQQQKDQIKALQQSGDLMGAQKLILAELTKEFGGSAEAAGKTFGGQLTILKTQLGNVQEAIGGALIPLLSTLTTVVAPPLIAILNQIPTAFQLIGDAVRGFGAVALPVFDFLRDHAGPTLAGLVGVFGTLVAVAVPAILAWTGATLASVAAHVALAAATLAAYAPIVALAALVGVVAVGIYEAWSHNILGLRDITDQVMGWLKATVPPILDGIKQAFQDVVGFVSTLISGDWAGAWHQLGTLVSDARDLLVNTVLPGLWAGIKQFFLDTLPKIAEQLAGWGKAFVEWVAPEIPPLLLELGKLYIELEKWLLTVALPKIITSLAKWGAEFTAWVAPQIPPLLLELGKLELKLAEWILVTALPDIILKLAEWGKAFSGWVVQATTDLLAKLPGLALEVGKWILGQADPTQDGTIAHGMADMGTKAASALIDAIASTVKQLWHKIEDVFGGLSVKIPFIGGGGGGTGGGVTAPLTGFIKPIAGSFVQGFYTGTHRVESAIDWAAPRGTPIYAPNGGVIMATGFGLDGDSGRGLDLLMPGGWEIVTGHMSGIAVANGQAVTRGQLIGYSGSPELDGGAGSGAHLHMAIKHNGAYVSGNPADYVPLATGGIVTQPTLALIGEAGPEAVVPLNDTLALGGPGSEPTPVFIAGVGPDVEDQIRQRDQNAVNAVANRDKGQASDAAAASPAQSSASAPTGNDLPAPSFTGAFTVNGAGTIFDEKGNVVDPNSFATGSLNQADYTRYLAAIDRQRVVQAGISDTVRAARQALTAGAFGGSGFGGRAGGETPESAMLAAYRQWIALGGNGDPESFIAFLTQFGPIPPAEAALIRRVVPKPRNLTAPTLPASGASAPSGPQRQTSIQLGKPFSPGGNPAGVGITVNVNVGNEELVSRVFDGLVPGGIYNVGTR